MISIVTRSVGEAFRVTHFLAYAFRVTIGHQSGVVELEPELPAKLKDVVAMSDHHQFVLGLDHLIGVRIELEGSIW